MHNPFARVVEDQIDIPVDAVVSMVTHASTQFHATESDSNNTATSGSRGQEKVSMTRDIAGILIQCGDRPPRPGADVAVDEDFQLKAEAIGPRERRNLISLSNEVIPVGVRALAPCDGNAFLILLYRFIGGADERDRHLYALKPVAAWVDLLAVLLPRLDPVSARGVRRLYASGLRLSDVAV